MTDQTILGFETSSGARISRIPLEVFPNFGAYAYLLQKDEYNYLIDAGSGTDSSHEDLLKGLKQAGLQPSDLTHILLTHAHIDHYGGLSKLKPLTEAKIGCHELDVQTIARHDARFALMSSHLAAFLAGTGLAKEICDQLLSIYRIANSIFHSVPVDFTYDALGMRLDGFELIHLPGHCAGHVAIRFDDIVFCGDMVVEGVTPHLFPETISPFNGLDHYLDSLVRLEEWAKDARLILNGHDEPITDLHHHIENTHLNIIRRVSRAVETLDEPRTLAETCIAIYGEASGYNQFLMIEKTGAYIEYVYEHGMIEIANPDELEQGLPARYRRLRAIADEEILPNRKASMVE